MKAVLRVIAVCLAASVLPIMARAATPLPPYKAVVKNSANAASPKTVAGTAKRPPAERYYIVYVLTTESRIPKRYVYRYGEFLATTSPERIYFNRQLQLNGLKIVR